MLILRDREEVLLLVALLDLGYSLVCERDVNERRTYPNDGRNKLD